MKKLLAMVILAALGYVGYTKWSEWQNNKAPAEATALSEEATPSKEATPQSQKHLAPAGTYYLLQRVSFATDTGIVGLPPGTKVTVISTTPTGMHVTDGTNQFDVDAGQVTNDLDVAGRPPGLVQPVSATSAPANPAPANPAPNSSYYLLQAISVTTDSGVSDIAPGTRVTVISATPDGIHVTDGTNQFDVNASQITSDLQVAQQALKADSAAQAQLGQYRAQQEVTVIQGQQQQLQSHQQPQQATAGANAQQQARQTQISAIDQRLAKLTAKLSKLTDGHRYVYPETVQSRQVEINNTQAAITGLQAQLQQLSQ